MTSGPGRGSFKGVAPAGPRLQWMVPIHACVSRQHKLYFVDYFFLKKVKTRSWEEEWNGGMDFGGVRGRDGSECI